MASKINKKLVAFRLSEEDRNFILTAGSKLAPQYIKMGKKDYYSDTELLESILQFARKTIDLSEIADIQEERLKKIPIINRLLTSTYTNEA